MKIPYIEDMDKWRAEFTFNIQVRIRFSETDMFGHVNNVSPFIYFEEARIEFLKSLNLFNLEEQVEGVPVVADLQCDYIQQMYFDDDIRLYVKVQHIGNTSLDIHYMALNQKEVLCLTGRGRMVYIHPKTGKPVPLREEMKTKLAAERTI